MPDGSRIGCDVPLSRTATVNAARVKRRMLLGLGILVLELFPNNAEVRRH